MNEKKYKWVTIEEANSHWQKHYIGYEGEDGAIGRGDLWYLGNGTAATFNPYDPDWIDKVEEPSLFNLKRLKRELTEDEYHEYFLSIYDADSDLNNLLGLYTDLYHVEGEHEMDNSWTDYRWYNISSNIRGKDWYIRGVAPAPYPCSAFGIEDSWAFVLEDYLTGDRWWLHTSKEWIISMRNEMAPIYNNIFGVDQWDTKKKSFI